MSKDPNALGYKKLATLCFVEQGEKILMMKRRKEPNFGLWTAPGGKIEFAESPHDCVIREIKEETGLTIHQPRLAGIITEVAAKGNFNWLIFAYHVTEFAGDLIECTEGDLAWIDKQEITRLSLPESDYHFIPPIISRRPQLYIGKFYYDENLKMTHFEHDDN